MDDLRKPQTSAAKANSLGPIKIFPYALLRTPIRSYKRFVALHAAADLRETLLEFYRDEVIRRALYTKSRSLFSALRRHESAKTPIDDDTLFALYRYHARITTRCTPLMLFAGVGVVQVGDFEGARQAPVTDWRLDVFPSTIAIKKVARALIGRQDVRNTARFRFNETAMVRGGVISYFTAAQEDGAESYFPKQKVISIHRDAQLRPLFGNLARWWSWEELVQVILASRPNTSREMAEEYLCSMIDTDILLHSLQPSTIGVRPERRLHQIAASHLELRDFAELRQECQALSRLTDTPLSISDPSFDAAFAELERHPFIAATASSPDASTEDTRGGTSTQAILRIDATAGGIPQAPLLQLGELVRRAPALWHHRAPLYRQAIINYFAEGTIGSRIPLLDLVFRIAKGPSLEDMHPRLPMPQGAPLLGGGNRSLDRYFSDKFLDAELARQEQLELDLEELGKLGEQAGMNSAPELPVFLEALFRCVHRQGRPSLVHSLSTSHVGRFMNRFLHQDLEAPILRQLQEIWRLEEQRAAPALLAEITCSGGGRLIDVSQRPLTYAYQILAHGQPSVDEEHQIHLSDLSVYMSSRGPALWWEKRSVPVLARHLLALNAAYTPVVVHVLLALDDEPADWGLFLNENALPVRTARVCFKDVILLPRSWQLPPSLQAALKKPAQQRRESELRSLLEKWRERYELPRFVRLGSSERNAVDLDSPMALFEIEDMVKKGSSRVLEEFFEEGSPVVGDDGPLVAEAVAHLELAESPQPKRVEKIALDSMPGRSSSNLARTQIEQSELRAQHVFYPGSSWLFIKLYYGAGLGSHAATRQFFHDNLLGRFVAPLLFELEKAGRIANFHFVRYADPEAHLRLRLQPTTGSALELLEQLRGRLDHEARDGAFDKWTVATYEREVDRYGGPQLIAEAERLFTADSRLCLRILSAYHRDAIDLETDLQLLLPLRTLNTLYRSFGYDLRGRMENFRRLRDAHERSRPPHPLAKQALDAKYRRCSSAVQRLVLDLEANQVAEETPGQKRIAAWYKNYEQATKTAAAAYAAAAQSGSLSTELFDVLSSIFHMHCNRLLGSNELEAEIIYMSQRAVEAVIARLKKNAGPA